MTDRAGTLYVVATPIGNLEDITYRAVRVLGEVRVVAAEDTRTAVHLLQHFGLRPDKVISYFEGNEARRAAEFVARLQAGDDIAVVSEAGMPGISDPGRRLVAAALDAGVSVVVVPGPSAVVTALVASGLPSERFLFLGFPPREAGPRRELFGALRGERATMVFYEAPGRVGSAFADLADALGATRPAALARELTKFHEQIVRESLGDLAARYAETPPLGECTLVVAGASEAEVEQVAGFDVEAAARALLAEGMSPKEVAARLAVQTGKPRRQLYQLALVLRGGS